MEKVSYKAHFEVEEEDPELEIVDKYFRKKPAYREVEVILTTMNMASLKPHAL